MNLIPFLLVSSAISATTLSDLVSVNGPKTKLLENFDPDGSVQLIFSSKIFAQSILPQLVSRHLYAPPRSQLQINLSEVKPVGDGINLRLCTTGSYIRVDVDQIKTIMLQNFGNLDRLGHGLWQVNIQEYSEETRFFNVKEYAGRSLKKMQFSFIKVGKTFWIQSLPYGERLYKKVITLRLYSDGKIWARMI